MEASVLCSYFAKLSNFIQKKHPEKSYNWACDGIFKKHFPTHVRKGGLKMKDGTKSSEQMPRWSQTSRAKWHRRVSEGWERTSPKSKWTPRANATKIAKNAGVIDHWQKPNEFPRWARKCWKWMFSTVAFTVVFNHKSKLNVSIISYCSLVKKKNLKMQFFLGWNNIIQYLVANLQKSNCLMPQIFRRN